jgi:phosphoribosylaminoimidazolecarboxamide formyltransferase/IMP cyclohydrolase
MPKITRALLSVSDKTGLVEFARGLAARGIELLSTGGTAEALRQAGLPVREVSDFTGFPEMLDGRVKTLHPKVHAGLLHLRGNASHEATLAEHGLSAIDLLCVNLYPFEATIARPGVGFEEAVEQIDIGGPAMLRSAAKNFRSVTVVADPADYPRVLESLAAHDGDTDPALRLALAQKVFARVAAYNAAIAAWLADQLPGESAPRPLVVAAGPGQALRYGENPHQTAALHLLPEGTEPAIAHTDVLHGKEMSYNNYLDGHASLESARELAGEPGCSIIKHGNPCGYATGDTLAEALAAAWAGDPVSAFGSVITVTQPVDLAAAEFLKGRFVEVLIAPDYAPEALALLQAKSKQIRLLKLRRPFAPPAPGRVLRQIGGGWLAQDRDLGLNSTWQPATATPFPEALRPLALFGLKAVKHVKSNAIVLVREHRPGRFQLIGMGAGQPNRVDSVKKLAIARAKENFARLPDYLPAGPTHLDIERDHFGECVLVSDAFFPFPDNIDACAEAGIRHIVQPGGSVKDAEVVQACDRHGMAMVLTGMRHFLH